MGCYWEVLRTFHWHNLPCDLIVKCPHRHLDPSWWGYLVSQTFMEEMGHGLGIDEACLPICFVPLISDAM